MLTRKRKFEAPQTEVVFDCTSAEQWKALLGIWNLSGCHLHRKQLAIGVQATEKGGGWKRRCGHWRTPQFKQHKTLVKRRKMTDDEIFEEKFEDLEMTCVLTCAKCMEKEWPKKIITGDRSYRKIAVLLLAIVSNFCFRYFFVDSHTLNNDGTLSSFLVLLSFIFF